MEHDWLEHMPSFVSRRQVDMKYRIQDFQEALEKEARFHVYAPDAVVQEGRYQSDHESYPVRWIVREAFRQNTNRELYGSFDDTDTQVSRQRGMEYIYREFMHLEHERIYGTTVDSDSSNDIIPRIDLVLGALFASHLYTDHVLTDHLSQYRGQEHNTFLLPTPVHSTVEIILFWLGEHGALRAVIDKLTTTFNQSSRDTSITLFSVQQVLQYVLLSNVITVIYDADLPPGTPWSWRAPVHITALLEQLGDQDAMQRVVSRM